MVRISYQGASDASPITTKIHPYRLLWSRHSWYMIGRSTLHRAVRTFHVGRIQQIEILADKFKIPNGFRIDRYLKNAWHLIPEQGPDHAVKLRFSPLVARMWRPWSGIAHNTANCNPTAA